MFYNSELYIEHTILAITSKLGKYKTVNKKIAYTLWSFDLLYKMTHITNVDFRYIALLSFNSFKIWKLRRL